RRLFLTGRRLVQVESAAGATVLEAAFAARVVDEDASHGFRGGREEVSPAVPVRGPVNVHEAEVGLVDQGGGLEGLAGLLLRQPPCSQLPQLVVDQRQELAGGTRVALLDGRQDTRDVGHAGQSTARGTTCPARRWPEACVLRCH